VLGERHDRDPGQDHGPEDDADAGAAPGGQPLVVIFAKVKPRMAISANSASEQMLRIFGGQTGWLVKLTARAITAVAGPVSGCVIYDCRARCTDVNLW
jgi:hypothetical protein